MTRILLWLGWGSSALCFAFPTAREVNEPNVRVRGALVTFSQIVSLTERDAIHRRIGALRLSRSSRYGVDWVVPAEERDREKNGPLFRLCDLYKRERGVESCALNRVAKYGRHQDEPKGTDREVAPAPTPVVCDDVLDEHGEKPLLDGQLTALWAQQSSGVDLVHELLKPEMGKSSVKVGVFDAGFLTANLVARLSPGLRDLVKKDPERFEKAAPEKISQIFDPEAVKRASQQFHGDAVTNLISSGADPRPIGSGPLAEIAMMSRAFYESDGLTAAEEALKSEARVLNVSLGWNDFYKDPKRPDGHAALAARVFADLKKRGVILVKSAGNEFPDELSSTARGAGAILVGSSHPSGLASRFSSEGAEVDILAPSDFFVQTVGKAKALNSFGGTSGAAPLVTGAIANVAALLPELTPEQARLIVKKTAIRGFNSREKPQRNGAGLLNAYQMAAVAMRLKDAWPTNQKRLGEDSLYDFTAEIKEALEQAEAGLSSTDCAEQKKGFRALRKAFFLGPENQAVRDRIAAIYEKKGRAGNAKFFRGLSMTPDQLVAEAKAEIRARGGKPGGDTESTVSLALRNLRSEGRGLFESMARSETGGAQHGLDALARLKDPALLKPFLNSGTPSQKADAVYATRLLPADQQAPLLKVALEDPSSDVFVAAAIAAQNRGTDGLPYFLRAAERASTVDSGRDDPPELRLVKASWSLGSERGKLLSRIAAKAKESDTLAAIAEQLPGAEFDALPVVEALFANPPGGPSAANSMLEKLAREKAVASNPRFVALLLDLVKKGGSPEASAALKILWPAQKAAHLAAFEKLKGEKRRNAFFGMLGKDALADPDFLKILEKEVDGDHAPLARTATLYFLGARPERAEKLSAHASSVVRDAVLDVIGRKDESTELAAWEKKFLRASLSDPSAEVRASALFHAANRPGELNELALSKLTAKDSSLDERRIVIGAGSGNAAIAEKVRNLAFAQPSTIPVACDHYLGDTDSTSDDRKIVIEKVASLGDAEQRGKIWGKAVATGANRGPLRDVLLKLPEASQREITTAVMKKRFPDASFLEEAGKSPYASVRELVSKKK